MEQGATPGATGTHPTFLGLPRLALLSVILTLLLGCGGGPQVVGIWKADFPPGIAPANAGVNLTFNEDGSAQFLTDIGTYKSSGGQVEFRANKGQDSGVWILLKISHATLSDTIVFKSEGETLVWDVVDTNGRRVYKFVFHRLDRDL